MVQKQTNCLKYAGILMVLHLLLIQSAFGEGICTELNYGTEEDGYMPVLNKYCCPGYEEVKADLCRPICDLGCPENSLCVSPNLCGCETGFEIDELYHYYGIGAIKSCKSVGYLSVISIYSYSAGAIVLVGTLFLLIKCLKKKPETSCEPVKILRCKKNRRKTVVENI